MTFEFRLLRRSAVSCSQEGRSLCEGGRGIKGPFAPRSRIDIPSSINEPSCRLSDELNLLKSGQKLTDSPILVQVYLGITIPFCIILACLILLEPGHSTASSHPYSIHFLALLLIRIPDETIRQKQKKRLKQCLSPQPSR